MSLFTAMFVMAPRRQQEEILQFYGFIMMLAFLFVCIVIASDYFNGTLSIDYGDKVEI